MLNRGNRTTDYLGAVGHRIVKLNKGEYNNKLEYVGLFLIFILVGMIVVAVSYATAGFAEILLVQELKEEEEKENENNDRVNNRVDDKKDFQSKGESDGNEK